MPNLPDTNVWIHVLRDRSARLRDRFAAMQPADIVVCSIVKAELYHGAKKFGHAERRLDAVKALLHPYQSLPFDDLAAERYADLRHDLEKQGLVIGPNDLKIAAICLVHDVTLVTSNTDEFNRVAGLKLDNWLA